MAKITGSLGSATFNSVAIYITDWNIDIKTDVIPTTDSSNTTWKEFLASGFKEWSGSFSGFQETGTADPTIGGTAATLKLNLDSTRYYQGSAIITGVSTNANVVGTDAVKKTFTFQGTGTLTLTNA